MSVIWWLWDLFTGSSATPATIADSIDFGYTVHDSLDFPYTCADSIDFAYTVHDTLDFPA